MPRLLTDEECLVRLAAEQRVPLEMLKALEIESKPDVLEVIQQRLVGKQYSSTTE